MNTITTTCKTEFTLDFHAIRNFQGDLKIRTLTDIPHLKRSIQEHGFSFPIYVWRHDELGRIVYDCLDGHGRITALHELESEGYEIPEVPVVFIDAKDINDARERLIQVNTLSSPFTETGLQDLVISLPDISIADYTIPDIDTTALSEHIGLLRNTLAMIDDINPDPGNRTVPIDEPVRITKASKTIPQTQEIIVQCTQCGKPFTHFVMQ